MDAGKSSLTITEDLVNSDLRETLLSLASPYLTDYRVAFREGSIDLTLEGEFKAAGPVTAVFRIRIADIRQTGSVRNCTRVRYRSILEAHPLQGAR